VEKRRREEQRVKSQQGLLQSAGQPAPISLLGVEDEDDDEDDEDFDPDAVSEGEEEEGSSSSGEGEGEGGEDWTSSQDEKPRKKPAVKASKRSSTGPIDLTEGEIDTKQPKRSKVEVII
jgi:hypothetical protein